MVHAVSLELTRADFVLSERQVVEARARDRRLAAIHEAGHFVVGRHLGLRWSEAWIHPLGEPTFFMKAWSGNHRCWERDRARLSTRRQHMIAVAGCVAERAWKTVRRPNEFCGCDEEDLLDPDVMSDTDWAAAGHTPGEPTTRLFSAYMATDKLFTDGGPLWLPLLAAARALIRDGFVEHGTLYPRMTRTFRNENALVASLLLASEDVSWAD